MILTKVNKQLIDLADKIWLQSKDVQLSLMQRDVSYSVAYNAICKVPEQVWKDTPSTLLPKRGVSVILWSRFKYDDTCDRLRNHLRELQNVGSLQYEFYPEEHCRVSNSNEKVLVITTTPKETTMIDASAPFSTVNYVYGNDISTLSKEQLIAAIRKAECERNHLKGIQQESKAITTMVTKIDEAILKIVAVLDAKV